MSATESRDATAPLALPALAASHAGVWIAAPDGGVRGVGRGEAMARAGDSPHLLLNAPVTASQPPTGAIASDIPNQRCGHEVKRLAYE